MARPNRDSLLAKMSTQGSAPPRTETRALSRVGRPGSGAPARSGGSGAAGRVGLAGLSEFQRGYLAGYDDGLSKCGPLAGLTRYFERRRERAKIRRRYDEEALEAMRQEIARLEGERETGRRVLTNPSDVASAAIGGGLGGLALGPVGAAAGAASGVYLKDRFDRRGKKTKKNPMKLYGVIGDQNPIKHWGGVVYEEDYGPHVIYFQAWDDESENLSVYDVPIDNDVVGENSWIDWDAVAESRGIDVKELKKYGASKDPLARASVVEAAAGYYGWGEFDQGETTMTISEAEERYGTMVDAAHAAASARRKKATKKKTAKKTAKGPKKPRI